MTPTRPGLPGVDQKEELPLAASALREGRKGRAETVLGNSLIFSFVPNVLSWSDLEVVICSVDRAFLHLWA